MENYVPIKNDEIDLKMGEFINSDSEKPNLKIMFLRQKNGVYHYKTHQILISIENENLFITHNQEKYSISKFLSNLENEILNQE